MARVFRAQGRPSPTKMSNTLLPMELDTAMSPIPKQTDRVGVVKQQKQMGREKKGTERQHEKKSEWAVRRQEGTQGVWDVRGGCDSLGQR